MNNFEVGQRLLEEAREFLPEMHRAFERGSWNVVVRRSQEIVELSLKAVLKMMAIEYPKEHDVGDVFVETCIARGAGLTSDELDDVRQISARLARERQPSFYMERQYSQADAMAARRGAERVLALVERVAHRIRRADG